MSMQLEAQQYTFSEEGRNVRQSLIRSLIAHAVDPEIISFAAGLPASEHLPVDDYRACLDAVLTRDGARAMQYGPAYGPLREWIAAHMQSRGIPCSVDQVFITNGSQQGLTILSRLFLDPGAPAVVEEATFTGINLVTGGRGAEVRAIPTDLRTGADMEAMAAAFAQEPKPRLAVLIPDFHNPLGVSLSAPKRQQAAELANRYGVPLIEDDPYSLLRFGGEPLPPIKYYDDNQWVFYLGSFSKIMAPGLRLGWLIAPAELIPQITTVREAIDLESSTLTQRAVTEFMQRGLLEAHLARTNAANKERCGVMLASLQEHLGDIARWSEPQGGMFIWVTLNDTRLNTMDLLQEAIANKVVYIPGVAFAAVGGQQNALRLNFSNVTPQRIADGVKRLAGVLRNYI